MRPWAALLVPIAMAAEAQAQPQVSVSVATVFASNCIARHASGELDVTVTNPGAASVRGLLVLTVDREAQVSAQTALGVRVEVPGHGARRVRLASLRPVPFNPLRVQLFDESGRRLVSEPVRLQSAARRFVLDATREGRLARADAMVNEPLPGDLDAEPFYCTLAHDPVDAGLSWPRTREGYGGVTAVVSDASVLAALDGDARVALGDYLLGGGQLFVAVDAPSALRSETLARLVGGEVRGRPASAADALSLRFVPWRAAPRQPLATSLLGARFWEGDNLQGDWFERVTAPAALPRLGASNAYGFGFVHLLSWDATHTPALDDPWSVETLRALAHNAASTASVAWLHPEPETLSVPAAVSAWLFAPPIARPSPAEALQRWAPAALGAALFALAAHRRRGAALALTALSGLTAVATYRAAREARRKVLTVRQIHLTEFAAGARRGVTRGWVGVSALDPQPLTWAAPRGHRLSVPSPYAKRTSRSIEGPLGAALTMPALDPDRGLVLRDDGPDSLSGSLDIVSNQDGVRLTNRFAETLYDLVLFGARDGGGYYLARLDPGVTAVPPGEAPWQRVSAASLARMGLDVEPSAQGGADPDDPAVRFAALARPGAPPERPSWLSEPSNALAWMAGIAVAASPSRSLPTQLAAQPSVFARRGGPDPSALRFVRVYGLGGSR